VAAAAAEQQQQQRQQQAAGGRGKGGGGGAAQAAAAGAKDGEGEEGRDDEERDDEDEDDENTLRQAILLNGETGSGKSVASQIVVEYIATRRPVGGVEPSAAAARLAGLLRDAGTLMEAFGHAKTTRNLNASRYGRTISLELNKDGGLCRCLVRAFMLERTRVTSIHDPERNFHIFYAMMHAAEDGLLAPESPLVRLRLSKLRLDKLKPSELTYLNGSTHHEVRSELRRCDDRQTLVNVFGSLQRMGSISTERAIAVLRLAGAILLVGQIELVEYAPPPVGAAGAAAAAAASVTRSSSAAARPRRPWRR
jgi:myosin heavy subunit